METLKALLAKPSVASWKEIIKIGKHCSGKPDWQTFSALVLAAVPSWPKEIQRDCPDSWPLDFREKAEWRVREVDTYGHYIQRICCDPRLQLGGKQRVWLERRFTGGVVPASSAQQVISTLLEAVQLKSLPAIVRLVREAISVLAGSIRNTGKTGTADLTGGLILVLRHTCCAKCGKAFDLYDAQSLDNNDGFGKSKLGASHLMGHTTCGRFEPSEALIEVRLEIEIKIGQGKQRPDQAAREASVRARGGCYILCFSVEEAIEQILLFIHRFEHTQLHV